MKTIKLLFNKLVVINLFFTISFFSFSPLANADELKKLRKDQAKILRQTEDNWISWRYFNSRIMFYTSHLITYRCGIDELYFGLSEDDLSLYPIGVPQGDPETPEFKLAQFLYENYPNGCDIENPFAVSTAYKIYEYVDELNEEESDSLIGLDEENKIESIFIQINFADGKKSKVKEIEIPTKILRQMEFENQ
tara:strand:+ start:75 stop:653 length:579 start_codon:yes stop_codon:yes gene_type:complete